MRAILVTVAIFTKFGEPKSVGEGNWLVLRKVSQRSTNI